MNVLSVLKSLSVTSALVSLFHFLYFRSNININDVLGNYSLTLIDTLDTLLVSCFTLSFCALYFTQIHAKPCVVFFFMGLIEIKLGIQK